MRSRRIASASWATGTLEMDLGMGLVTHIFRFTRSERLSATLELDGGTNGICTHTAAFTEPNANCYTMAP